MVHTWIEKELQISPRVLHTPPDIHLPHMYYLGCNMVHESLVQNVPYFKPQFSVNLMYSSPYQIPRTHMRSEHSQLLQKYSISLLDADVSSVGEE